MKIFDRVTKILNIFLGILYVPFSVFCFSLQQMASESVLSATDPTLIKLTEIFSFISFLIPISCVFGIALSVFLRRKGHSVWSFIIQFLPFEVIFALNFILSNAIGLTETM